MLLLYQIFLILELQVYYHKSSLDYAIYLLKISCWLPVCCFFCIKFKAIWESQNVFPISSCPFTSCLFCPSVCYTIVHFTEFGYLHFIVAYNPFYTDSYRGVGIMPYLFFIPIFQHCFT